MKEGFTKIPFAKWKSVITGKSGLTRFKDTLDETVNKYRTRLLSDWKLHRWTAERVDEASVLLNKMTGYDVCERLRQKVNECDEAYCRLRAELQESRTRFTNAIRQRSQCQKELNMLLQKKATWEDTDIGRFTEMYREEIKFESIETAAKEANELLESQVDQAHIQLMNALRDRYQEEQLWSDKIRRASTFGTFALMLGNLGLFVVLQVVIEPKKRGKFVREFAEALDERLSRIESIPSHNSQPNFSRLGSEQQSLDDGVQTRLVDQHAKNMLGPIQDHPNVFVEGALVGFLLSILLKIYYH